MAGTEIIRSQDLKITGSWQILRSSDGNSATCSRNVPGVGKDSDDELQNYGTFVPWTEYTTTGRTSWAMGVPTNNSYLLFKPIAVRLLFSGHLMNNAKLTAKSRT